MGTQSARKPARHWLLPGTLALLSSIAVFLAAPKFFAKPAVSPLPILGSVPPFELTERSGRQLGKDDLLGTIWVADFIFTSCDGPCPLMTRQLAKLQKEIPHQGVRLVSFSVDPETDTPQVLDAYAGQFGADPDLWWFFTGDKKKIHTLSRNGFLLAAKEAKGELPVLHSSKFVLVDKNGHIRAYYSGMGNSDLERIKKGIRNLLQEAQP